MWKRKLASLVLFILGLFFIVNSKVNITGAAIGVSVSSTLSIIVGLFLILIAVIFTIKIEEKVKEELKRRIRPKKELIAEGWTPKELTFRRKLINLFDKHKPIDPKKIAYLLKRYEKTWDTGDIIKGKRGAAKFHVYKGRLKKGGEEYFTVDTAETFNLNLGKRRYEAMPYHIDIQQRVHDRFHKIREEPIEWDKKLEKNKDVVRYYGLTVDSMLENLRKKREESH